ncbi:hypothetical protein AABB24_025783, partial [Solanum stoloniferum]
FWSDNSNPNFSQLKSHFSSDLKGAAPGEIAFSDTPDSMADPSCARAFPSFQCRSDPDFSGGVPRHDLPNAGVRFSGMVNSLSRGSSVHGMSSLILRFPPNFVRQLSVKARRNCSNIGLAQVVAASWSNNHASPDFTPAAKAVDAAAIAPFDITTGDEEGAVVEDSPRADRNVQMEDLTYVKYSSFLSSDGSIAIHASMRSSFVFSNSNV